ncbi:hypothetical protein [Brevibacillus parabrevis]|uniref:hypothetical protein n=1 Tax=Brevibacillus parabrevis TaxID=54914 RepID=UPI00113C6976|nr:hypothetical protein [Brevibacillus parabrevis]TGV28020.1 hypothetical protein EN829_042600 [Mesorhizobium sp. M00.F.Ca.ET.186.01.1.1]
MNIKKLSFATLLLSSLVVSGAGSAFAVSQGAPIKIGNLQIVERVYENPVEYDFTDALTKNDSSKFRPLGNDMTGKIGASAETKVNWRIIEGKVGINAEVSFGSEDTVETTHTWVIPKRTLTTVEYGSKAVKTTGSLVEYFQGRVKDSHYVNVKYSYKEYSSKKSRDL